jgi:hypothetical protein
MTINYKFFIISFFVLLLGVTSISANNNLPIESTLKEVQNPQRFVIYYDGDIDLLVKDKDNYLKSFLDAYNLEIVNTFQIDEHNKGFSIITKAELTISSHQLARELSMLDHVIMVQLIDESIKKIES